jgi:hypothetical protein
MNANIRPDILTASGHYFDFIHPEKNVIDLFDIANALSNLCRFNGHTSSFYSVAQHSVLVSHLVPQEFAMAGLLHDAAEAYVGDMTRPLKNLLPWYKKIERDVEQVIFSFFGLPPDLPACVKDADLKMLSTEQRDLMPAHDDEWALISGIEPLSAIIEPWTPREARSKFIDRYQEITSVLGDHRKVRFDRAGSRNENNEGDTILV